MSGMQLWVDDLRDLPEPGWTVARTSEQAIAQLDRYRWDVVSLDHDLGGEDTTRRLLLWLCEGGEAYWPAEVRVHSSNEPGARWLVGMAQRYSPEGTPVVRVHIVCHTTVRYPDKISPGPTHRCETARINREADEHDQCYRCAVLDDLGPIVHASRGEVRRSPDGEFAVCVRDPDGWRNGSDWRLITDETVPGLHGWRSDWDVARWEHTGNVLDV